MFNKDKLNQFLLETINKDVDTVFEWKELDLSNKYIKDLPNDIGYLVSLKTLCLSHNYLTALPEGLHHLVNLKCLILSHNLLTSKPNLDDLKLTHLYLHGNHFYPVPKRNCINLI